MGVVCSCLEDEKNIQKKNQKLKNCLVNNNSSLYEEKLPMIDEFPILKEKKQNNNINFFINSDFLARENELLRSISLSEISGILKLSLLIFISNITDDYQFEKINNGNVKEILKKLHKNLTLKNKGFIENEEKLPNDIQTILKEKEGNNIIEYTKFINSKVKTHEIQELFEIYKNEQKENIKKFMSSLIKYEKYNSFFEEEFNKAQKESIFDYSLVNLAIIDNETFDIYEEAKQNCPNCVKKILFHGSQIGPISEILSSEFKYTRKAFYGMGIYFTDILDYVLFYCGGKNFHDRRKYFNKILPPNSTFSFVASEVFYNKELFKHIRDSSYKVASLDHYPKYEELATDFSDKMIPKNGIYYITVKSDHGQIIKDSVTSMNLREEGKFIGNEYVITEKEQICPIYGITLKRNEFFVVWRDLNFSKNNKYGEYLKRRELYANEIAEMNVYLENSTEML